MVIENVWQLLFVALAVYGGANLGYKLQVWLNS